VIFSLSKKHKQVGSVRAYTEKGKPSEGEKKGKVDVYHHKRTRSHSFISESGELRKDSGAISGNARKRERTVSGHCRSCLSHPYDDGGILQKLTGLLLFFISRPGKGEGELQKIFKAVAHNSAPTREAAHGAFATLLGSKREKVDLRGKLYTCRTRAPLHS